MPSEVALARCSSYDREEVFRAVKKAVSLLGGIKRFVKPGAAALIKPNMLSAKPPEDAITTHPEIVRAAIKLVREAGGIPRVGDSHGGSHYKMKEVYARTGIGKVCDEENAEKLVFEKFKEINGIPVALDALEADAIISLPKFKTHSLTTLTAGIKNMFGAVPGLYKTRCHMEAPNPAAFAKLLAEVYGRARPRLTILDGITAMEGEGPGSAGTPVPMELVAASADAVSLDAVLCGIIGISPLSVPLIREAKAKNLGEAEDIKILGEKQESFYREGFKLPGATLLHKLPNALLRPVSLLLKTFPDADPAACVRCGACVESCPAGAVTEGKNGLRFDRKKCILCLCCMEFCPHNAVYIRKNLLFRILRP